MTHEDEEYIPTYYQWLIDPYPRGLNVDGTLSVNELVRMAMLLALSIKIPP